MRVALDVEASLQVFHLIKHLICATFATCSYTLAATVDTEAQETLLSRQDFADQLTWLTLACVRMSTFVEGSLAVYQDPANRSISHSPTPIEPGCKTFIEGFASIEDRHFPPSLSLIRYSYASSPSPLWRRRRRRSGAARWGRIERSCPFDNHIAFHSFQENGQSSVRDTLHRTASWSVS